MCKRMTDRIVHQIGFLGAGQMAQALASGFVSAGLAEAGQITAADPAASARGAFLQQLPGATVVADSKQLLQKAAILFLAVKPQHVQTAAQQIGPLSKERLLVSIAAGVPLGKLTTSFQTDRVIRVMPNTPALVGCCAAGYCASAGATEADRKLVGQLLSSVGIAFEVEEKLLDAVTGLSGSGPAFVYMVIEALSDGGVRMGLPREMATALAAQTVRGAAQMVLERGEHPAVLKDRVASPGGTTIAGLHALETAGLRAALIHAVEAATNRSRELGE